MIHYSCDLCGKSLSAEDQRYVVKMDVHEAVSPLSADDDNDIDHLEELGELLEQMGDDDEVEAPAPESCELRFDLCPECQKKFLKDPLGRESALKQLNFSAN